MNRDCAICGTPHKQDLKTEGHLWNLQYPYPTDIDYYLCSHDCQVYLRSTMPLDPSPADAAISMVSEWTAKHG